MIENYWLRKQNEIKRRAEQRRNMMKFIEEAAKYITSDQLRDLHKKLIEERD